MVVSVSQQTINDQFVKLAAAGAVPTSMCLYQTGGSPDYVFQAAPGVDAIPDGMPYIAASYLPQIDIVSTGTDVNLVLAFRAGKARLAVGGGGYGPLATLTEFDMTGWRYALPVSLGFRTITQADLAGTVPRNQLAGLAASMFEIQSLFLDLESADLIHFDAGGSTAGPPGDAAALDQFALFMQHYLAQLVKDHSRFVLGYVTSATACTHPAPSGVPDVLLPTGAAFTVYHDPDSPGLSNVNFALVTKGGHATIRSSPPNFTGNVLQPEGCGIKAVYSHSCLTAPLLVHPVYRQLRQGIYQKISGHVSVGPGRPWPGPPPGGGLPGQWQYGIADFNGGADDRYQNSFTVTAGSAPGVLHFSGTVSVYKEVSQDDLFCTARAWAKADMAWSGTTTLSLAGDGSVTVARTFGAAAPSTDSDSNSCADAFSWIGGILGGVLDLFTGWSDQGYFSSLISQAFAVNTPGVGDIGAAPGRLAQAIRTAIVLPTGGVLAPQAVSFDSALNVAIPMTVQPES